MSYKCNQCEPGCDGSSNTRCFACGSPVCVSCSRRLKDSYSKGARRRICLNCASDWPERFGFRDWRKQSRSDGGQRVEPHYFWAATEPTCLLDPATVLATARASEVAAVMAEDSRIQVEGWNPPYREFK